jgi:glycosyltransferase involved in cell wall biosynthesis
MTQSRRTRILYANHTGLVSGAERMLLTMLQVLNRTQYEPYVLCPAEGELSRLAEALDVPCLQAPQLHARFTWRPDRLLRYAASLWRTIVATRKAIRALDPGLVHANSLRAGIVATLATIGTNRLVIWHVHDILPRHPVSTAIRLLAYTSRRTQIVAVSHFAARAFCGRLSFRDRVHTIHNGTDLSRFPLKAHGNSTFRRQAGIPDEAFLVCAVGQICARKGLIELLNAFSTIYAQTPNMHLAVVGKAVFAHEEEYQELLVKAAIATGVTDRVHFTGERSDVASILQASDLLVLNSFEEPFGLVLVEALSSGTPVLATRVGGIPEIVRDSENGWLVERGDTSALASKLLELSQNIDMLDQAAEFARVFTCPQFSLERFQNNLHRLYAELDYQAAITSDPGALTELARYRSPQGGWNA